MQLWSEHPVPERYHNCTKCELAEQRTRIIWGEGNPFSPLLVVLDNPGAREDAQGKSFVCATRETLYRAVTQAGLSERDVYLGFVLRCRPRRKYDKPLARTTCLAYLWEQTAQQRPKLILCLGNVAVQSLFANPTLEVKNLRGNCHEVRGFPTLVSYHPLAVYRRPVLAPLFQADWQQAADYILTT